MAASVFVLLFIFAEIVKIVVSINPLLTYVLRIPKLTYHPSIVGNYTINQYNGNQFLNGHMKFNVTDVDKVIVTFHRCNLEGINCEYFQSWTLIDLCPKLKDKNQMWSKFYGAFEPPMVCPLNKINYKFTNATFGFNESIKWYPDVINYYWKLTQKMYAGDIYAGGITIDIYVFGYRKRNSRPKH